MTADSEFGAGAGGNPGTGIAVPDGEPELSGEFNNADAFEDRCGVAGIVGAAADAEKKGVVGTDPPRAALCAPGMCALLLQL